MYVSWRTINKHIVKVVVPKQEAFAIRAVGEWDDEWKYIICISDRIITAFVSRRIITQYIVITFVSCLLLYKYKIKFVLFNLYYKNE